jgi:hypothetical protein
MNNKQGPPPQEQLPQEQLQQEQPQERQPQEQQTQEQQPQGHAPPAMKATFLRKCSKRKFSFGSRQNNTGLVLNGTKRK